MAIGLRLEFAGATVEQYEATHRHMNIEGDPPVGLLFHSSGPTASGWGVVDFWESRDAFDCFLDERLAPAVVELGDEALPGQPDVEEFPVHNTSRPWLLRWGNFAVSGNSPAMIRARGAVARLSPSRPRPAGAFDSPSAGPPVVTDAADGDPGLTDSTTTADRDHVVVGVGVDEHPGGPPTEGARG